MVVESASAHKATAESPALVADIDGIHSEYTFATKTISVWRPIFFAIQLR
jgi:hypothetical protein